MIPKLARTLPTDYVLVHLTRHLMTIDTGMGKEQAIKKALAILKLDDRQDQFRVIPRALGQV